MNDATTPRPIGRYDLCVDARWTRVANDNYRELSDFERMWQPEPEEPADW